MNIHALNKPLSKHTQNKGSSRFHLLHYKKCTTKTTRNTTTLLLRMHLNRNIMDIYKRLGSRRP